MPAQRHKETCTLTPVSHPESSFQTLPSEPHCQSAGRGEMPGDASGISLRSPANQEDFLSQGCK